ncbi:MAG: M67 family metallopeptidase [Acidobacteria bacterium]|nr:M67 family metallopeptidase [Acidobacteriota bacterium]
MLTLTAGADRGIRRHGRETYPYECCGALIGSGERVVEALALPNAAEKEARRRFRVRPTDYLAAERRASELGAGLLGFYHSHPDHPARPSRYDLEHAWPGFAYVIVAVDRGEPAALTSWRLREDRSAFDEEAVTVAAEGGAVKRTGETPCPPGF